MTPSAPAEVRQKQLSEAIMRREKLITLGFSVLGVVGAYAIYALLVYTMVKVTAPPPVNQTRVGERHKALAEVRAAEQQELYSYGKLDAAKGLYRLKVEHAMAMTEALYKNAAAARTNLISRAEKANFVPPPPTFE